MESSGAGRLSLRLALAHLVGGLGRSLLVRCPGKGRSSPRRFPAWKHDSLALQFPETALSHPGAGRRALILAACPSPWVPPCVPVWTPASAFRPLSHWVPHALTLILAPSHLSSHTPSPSLAVPPFVLAGPSCPSSLFRALDGPSVCTPVSSQTRGVLLRHSRTASPAGCFSEPGQHSHKRISSF